MYFLPVLPRGISNEMARHKEPPRTRNKSFFLSFMRHFPQIKKEGKKEQERKREGNPSVIISFVFLQPSLVINGSDPLSHLLGNSRPPALRSLGRSHQRGHWWRSIILRHTRLDCLPCQYPSVLRPFDIDCLKGRRPRVVARQSSAGCENIPPTS